MEPAAAKKLLQEADAMELYDFVTEPFTPGQLYEKLDDTYPKVAGKSVLSVIGLQPRRH